MVNNVRFLDVSSKDYDIFIFNFKHKKIGYVSLRYASWLISVKIITIHEYDLYISPVHSLFYLYCSFFFFFLNIYEYTVLLRNVVSWSALSVMIINNDSLSEFKLM